MCYKTVTDVDDDGFGYRTPACREYTHPRAESDSRIDAAIPERTIILDQFFKFIFYNFLALMALKFRFHPRQRQIEITGLSYAEERTDLWMS